MDSWVWFVWEILFGMVFCSVVLFFGAIPDAKEIIVYEKIPVRGVVDVERTVFVGDYPSWFDSLDSIEQRRIEQEVKKVYANRKPVGAEDDRYIRTIPVSGFQGEWEED